MVASLPVLAKRTTSAEGTMRRRRSAASTSAEVAAAKCEPCAMACETDFNHLGMSVSLDERAERHHEVDVFVAVGVPDVRALAALQKYRAG